MSAADVGIGDPPRQGATFFARAREIAARVYVKASRLLAQDEGALAAWVAALAAAPQAVPNLPRPPNKRLTGFVVGFVVGAHLALLAVLYWRSPPPPPPEAEMTVELVHDMPEAAKPKPPEGKPAPKAPERPVQEGTSAEHKQATQEQGKPEQQAAKSEQHQAKQEPKPAEPKQEQKSDAKAQPKAEPPKPAHREAHRAPPKGEQREQAQQKALEAKIQELQKAQEALKQEQAQQRQELQQQQASASQAQRGPGLDMPAIALPGTSDAGTESVSYPQLVLSQVAKAKKEGRYMGVPGYAGVRFRVAEDGSVEMVKLVSSSGDPNLDIEAEAMIRRAAPFPKPPPGGRRDYGITLVFRPQP